MTENESQGGIVMEGLAKTQNEVVGLEKNDFKYIRDGEQKLEHSNDYLNEIFNEVKKLSGIITCLRRVNGEVEDFGDDFMNLAWAMSHFTDALDRLASELWDHLKDIDALQK